MDVTRTHGLEVSRFLWNPTRVSCVHHVFSSASNEDERDFQASKEYILRFYRWSLSAHEDFTGSPQPEGSTLYAAFSTLSNSSISASFKGSSPKHALSYRNAIRSWHLRTLPWRGPERGPVEVPTHLRIDTSTRLSPRIGAFYGNGDLRPERDGRST
ncbi:hypothetical protein CRG98_021893 [Punica granatum]|uniref:Uncharacterized protein n=1 Tax=Punica granatum TaxID=22663 RepID=A0A2I0JN58_PUNGR|nr:hypothetical protein CRG98_021893 [Punica granatum]